MHYLNFSEKEMLKKIENQYSEIEKNFQEFKKEYIDFQTGIQNLENLKNITKKEAENTLAKCVNGLLPLITEKLVQDQILNPPEESKRTLFSRQNNSLFSRITNLNSEILNYFVEFKCLPLEYFKNLS